MTSGGAIRFRLLGERVLVPLFWLAVAVVLVAYSVIDESVPRGAGVGNPARILAVVALVLIGVASLLVHQAGHAILHRRLREATSDSQLLLFGDVPLGFRQPDDPRTEFLEAVVGPVANGVVALLCGGLWLLARSADMPRSWLAFAALVNTVLALVNAMPGLPLDGGRILRAFVWYLSGSYASGTRVAGLYGQFLSTSGLIAGAVILGSHSHWRWLGAWALVGAWAIGRAGRDELSRARVVFLGARLTAGELVAGLNPHLGAEDTLESALDALLSQTLVGPALVMEERQVVGLLALDHLRRFARREWPDQPARAAMVPRGELASIPAQAPAALVFERLAERGLSYLLVVDEAGGVLGAIDRQLASRRLYDRSRDTRTDAAP